MKKPKFVRTRYAETGQWPLYGESPRVGDVFLDRKERLMRVEEIRRDGTAVLLPLNKDEARPYYEKYPTRFARRAEDRGMDFRCIVHGGVAFDLERAAIGAGNLESQTMHV